MIPGGTRNSRRLAQTATKLGVQLTPRQLELLAAVMDDADKRGGRVRLTLSRGRGRVHDR